MFFLFSIFLFLDVNEKDDLDCNGDEKVNDDENEVELEGGVGGESSVLVDPNLQISTDSHESSGEVITGLLDEMLRKVDGIAGQLFLTPFSS